MEFENRKFENLQFENLQLENVQFKNSEFERLEFENSELKSEKLKGFFGAGVRLKNFFGTYLCRQSTLTLTSTDDFGFVNSRIIRFVVQETQARPHKLWRGARPHSISQILLES